MAKSDITDALVLCAEEIIAKETKELRRLIQIVNDNVVIRMSRGDLVSDIEIDSFGLEALVMRIPAECLRLQGAINRYNINNAFEDIELEASVTETLLSLEKKGTAEERRKRAESLYIDEKQKAAVNKQIVKGLTAYIERADKTYEGLKKVMDYRSKEGYFDRRGPM